MILTERSDGLPLLADDLNSSVVKTILGWREHPDLGRLLSKLLSHTNPKAFYDSYAEAITALHVQSNGCELRFEIPTPSGKRSDFEVTCGEQKFYLHVKRIDTQYPQHAPHRSQFTSAQLRALERIARPYIVQVRWNEQLSRDQMTLLVTQADAFIRRARVGDELIARDHDGRQLGGVRIIAPWEGDHVSVTVGLRSGFVDQGPRFRKMLHRAYQQFMPRAVNVILICSDHLEDAVDFETGLLGSHIERWDAFPPRGKRVAHGRAADGFWHGQRFSESQFVGWFHFAPHERAWQSRLWVRENVEVDAAMTKLLQRLFAAQTE